MYLRTSVGLRGNHAVEVSKGEQFTLIKVLSVTRTAFGEQMEFHRDAR